MVADSLSSASATSHTLSADPPQPPTTDLQSSATATSTIVSALSSAPHTFLQPPCTLHTNALGLAKAYLDPLASSVIEGQLNRRQNLGRKRKRAIPDTSAAILPLKLNRIYLNGFGIDQVWQQARKVLDAAADEVERGLAGLSDEEATQLRDARSTDKGTGSSLMRIDEDGFEVGRSDGESSLEDDSAAQSDLDLDLEDEAIEDEDDISQDELSHLDDSGEDFQGEEEPEEVFVEDPNGLNDGFFSIDAFNKVSTFLERQDALGDSAAEPADEEEIDWTVDPRDLNSNANGTTNNEGKGDVGHGQSEDDDDGPTFGNVDLHAPEGESDDGAAQSDELGDSTSMADAVENTNDVLYKDFFAPPPRKASRNDTRTKWDGVHPRAPPEDLSPPEDEGAVQRTIDAVRRDLFEDELSADEDVTDGENAATAIADPRSRRSTHERRQAKLAEEIRALEAANVAKREWTLSGEARAVDRPVNSLLEEDLDFERTGKPVPVITAAVSEDIEEMIKQRILTHEFDEIIRRRPDDLAHPVQTRRGRVELDDTKAQQSLADIYEEEHMKKVDPTGHQDKRDVKLAKEHAEVERLWADVSAKLDALSSWRYKPKPPKPSLNVVADVPTVALEDARPTAAVSGGADLGAHSMLAPQEIYTPGEGPASKGEVVLKSGAAVTKTEMSREEKLRRRRRAKERLKKSLAGRKAETSSKAGTGTKREKAEVVGALKKGNVHVIGQRGELRDVEGQQLKSAPSTARSGGFKL
ncbi:MAG: U3 snoRNP protein [Thelocarpon superellum]|nr:MAG: U3 snoRNP protein [Thelocarpon superellum]